jgi:hypothetical protein
MKITILADLYADGSHDPAVDQVADALREGGHHVSRLLVPDDYKAVTAGLARRKPDLVFHMIHDFGGESGLIATAALIGVILSGEAIASTRAISMRKRSFWPGWTAFAPAERSELGPALLPRRESRGTRVRRITLTQCSRRDTREWGR